VAVPILALAHGKWSDFPHHTSLNPVA